MLIRNLVLLGAAENIPWKLNSSPLKILFAILSFFRGKLLNFESVMESDIVVYCLGVGSILRHFTRDMI